jgi:hypothetical protein
VPELRPLTDHELQVLREGWGTPAERAFLEALQRAARAREELLGAEERLRAHKASPGLQALALRPDADAVRWFVARCFERSDDGPIFRTHGPEGAICRALWKHLELQEKAGQARADLAVALQELAQAEAGRAAPTPTKQGTGVGG